MTSRSTQYSDGAAQVWGMSLGIQTSKRQGPSQFLQALEFLASPRAESVGTSPGHCLPGFLLLPEAAME